MMILDINQNQDPVPVKSCINLYEDLNQVIEEMDLIKKVAVKIDKDKAEVHDHDHDQVSAAASCDASLTSMVCSASDEIMDQLVGGPPDLQVIPIVGMGGIGKTTLARNIYAHPLIMEYFGPRGWATISQQYNAIDILLQLLYRKGDQTERSIDELGELCKEFYSTRFLIVLDNMWSVDAWEEIRRFFPNNENGSRILVTTRLSQLSSQLNNNYSLQMKFLDEASSWNLFSKTVFGEETCPLELEEIGKEIVANCRGLPLSIVVVGGLLKKMEQARGCWETTRNKLTSAVNLENDKHCSRLLKISYDHLPIYLKPCFLSMGVFQEDDAIQASRITNLWICEGFLEPMNGKSLVAIAKGFLKKLVDRNLILIDKRGSKYYKIHDLLRDICLRESQKYGFYDVIGQESPQGTNRQRRVIIPGSISKEKVVDAFQSVSGARSVICENGKVQLCQDFGLLRTLHFATYNIDQNYVDALAFQCVNLQHLSIYVASMSSFLSSFHLFWNLHTLIASCDYECEAPVGIWKMPQFRHIEFTQEYFFLQEPSNEGDEDDDVVVLESFQILKGVKNFKCGEEVIKRIPNVRKLGIRYCDDDDYCLSNIMFLCKLESLHIDCDYNNRGEACDSSLHKLTFPHSLKSLHLEMDFAFELDEMLVEIGSLPLLQKLKLVGGCFGGTGTWEIVEGQFPSLNYLKLNLCRGLKHRTAQESSSIFPRLEQLHLYQLNELNGIPREFGVVPTLQLIRLFLCSGAAVTSAKEIVKEQQPPFHVQVWSTTLKQFKALQAPN